jgi:hypothetical protein
MNLLGQDSNRERDARIQSVVYLGMLQLKSLQVHTFERVLQVGLQLKEMLLQHMLRFKFSLLGALQWKRDMAEYQAVVVRFGVQRVSDAFEQVRALKYNPNTTYKHLKNIILCRMLSQFVPDVVVIFISILMYGSKCIQLLLFMQCNCSFCFTPASWRRVHMESHGLDLISIFCLWYWRVSPSSASMWFHNSNVYESRPRRTQ